MAKKNRNKQPDKLKKIGTDSAKEEVQMSERDRFLRSEQFFKDADAEIASLSPEERSTVDKQIEVWLEEVEYRGGTFENLVEVMEEKGMAEHPDFQAFLLTIQKHKGGCPSGGRRGNAFD
jgi:hypothetical protein